MKHDANSSSSVEGLQCDCSFLIMNAVSKEFFAGYVYSTSAHILWKDLKDRFDKIIGSRIFVTHRKVNSLIQGSLTISVYF